MSPVMVSISDNIIGMLSVRPPRGASCDTTSKPMVPIKGNDCQVSTPPPWAPRISLCAIDGLNLIERSVRRPPGAQVAQLVEHVTENHGVGGSIPPVGTN